MRKIMTLALAATTALSAVAFSTAASAQTYRYGSYYDRYYDRYRDNNDDDQVATAVIAGVIGLAVGAALGKAWGNNDRYGSYGGSYGYQPYNYNSYGYGQPYGYSTYGYGYDNSRYGYRCRTVTRWDPYYGRYVRRQVC